MKEMTIKINKLPYIGFYDKFTKGIYHRGRAIGIDSEVSRILLLFNTIDYNIIRNLTNTEKQHLLKH